MDPKKIAKMATVCLREVANAKTPFSEIDHFLQRLRNDPAWSDAEVVEVQTNVIRELMRQRKERPPN
jgi:hypothetical protein